MFQLVSKLVSNIVGISVRILWKLLNIKVCVSKELLYLIVNSCAKHTLAGLRLKRFATLGRRKSS